ncbi:MAG TPA: monovalent cation/H(+) antiporter subunit G [Terriglobales bacterium]|nr:monovalent cation/H(+) antiporter subunit G [Terriglobales bacterium]
MTEVLVAIFLVIGALFMLLGAVGVARMPDLFTRMQATSKASTLGIAAILGAVALHFGDSLAVTSRAFAVIAFVFLTTPVATQMIARAAHFINVPLWNTKINELAGQYDPVTHELHSFKPPTPTEATPTNMASVREEK